MAKFIEFTAVNDALVWVNVEYICSIVQHSEDTTAVHTVNKEGGLLAKYEDVKKLISNNQ